MRILTLFFLVMTINLNYSQSNLDFTVDENTRLDGFFTHYRSPYTLPSPIPLGFNSNYYQNQYNMHGNKYELNIDPSIDINDGLVDGIETIIAFDGPELMTPGKLPYNSSDVNTMMNYQIPLLKINNFNGAPESSNPYEVVFRDDFDFLDTNNWKVVGETAEEAAWIPGIADYRHPSMVTCEDGKLVISAEENPRVITWEENGTTYSELRTFSVGEVVSKNGRVGFESGCVKYGKMKWRADIPDFQTFSSIWTYGWAGEIDIYETHIWERYMFTTFQAYHSLFCGYPMPSKYMDIPALSGDLPQRNCASERKGHHYAPFERHDFNYDIPQTGFHDFELEWTPYKAVVKIDGEVVWSLYKYYRVKEDYIKREVLGENFSIELENTTVPVLSIESGLEYSDLVSSTNNVWENLAFDRLADYNLDVIMSVFVPGSVAQMENYTLEPLVIDYFELQQKAPAPTYPPLPVIPEDVCLTVYEINNIPTSVKYTIPTGVIPHFENTYITSNLPFFINSSNGFRLDIEQINNINEFELVNPMQIYIKRLPLSSNSTCQSNALYDTINLNPYILQPIQYFPIILQEIHNVEDYFNCCYHLSVNIQYYNNDAPYDFLYGIENNGNYTWFVDGVEIGTTDTNYIEACIPNDGIQRTIRVERTSPCATVMISATNTLLFQSFTCKTTKDPIEVYELRINPNPSSTVTNYEILKFNEVSQSYETYVSPNTITLSLYDNLYNPIKAEQIEPNKLLNGSFNLSGLKSGQYTVVANINGEIISRVLIIP